MSFSKTISVVAALTSIFGAGAAGWKLANENQTKPAEEVNNTYEQHITELQQKIADLEKQETNTTPPAYVPLPQETPTSQVAPKPTTLPPVVPPPPPVPQIPQEP
jgi:ribosomal protein S13